MLKKRAFSGKCTLVREDFVNISLPKRAFWTHALWKKFVNVSWSSKGIVLKVLSTCTWSDGVRGHRSAWFNGREFYSLTECAEKEGFLGYMYTRLRGFCKHLSAKEGFLDTRALSERGFVNISWSSKIHTLRFVNTCTWSEGVHELWYVNWRDLSSEKGALIYEWNCQ